MAYLLASCIVLALLVLLSLTTSVLELLPSMAFIFLATSTSGCPSSSLLRILAVRDFWMVAVMATVASPSLPASDLISSPTVISFLPVVGCWRFLWRSLIWVVSSFSYLQFGAWPSNLFWSLSNFGVQTQKCATTSRCSLTGAVIAYAALDGGLSGRRFLLHILWWLCSIWFSFFIFHFYLWLSFLIFNQVFLIIWRCFKFELL